jgi:hypothetical protein
MGLANKSVVLYEFIKIGRKWKFCPVDEDLAGYCPADFGLELILGSNSVHSLQRRRTGVGNPFDDLRTCCGRCSHAPDQ